MKNLLFALIILLVSCTTEKVNIIKGEIEGIKIGDKIYLTVGGPHYGNRYVSDSSIVKKDGEFILETKVSDANVYIHGTNSTESLNFDRINNSVGFFLEGYSTLNISGNISKADEGSFSDLTYARITGGLYTMPEMKALQQKKEEIKSLRKMINQIFYERKHNYSMLQKEKKEIYKIKNDSLYQEYLNLRTPKRKLSKQEDSLKQLFLTNNIDFAYSAHILQYKHDLKKNITEFEKAFLNLTPRVQKSREGEIVRDMIENMKRTEIGVIAPDFSAIDMDGNKISLSQFKGKFVLLDFWATGCGPCLAGLPALVKFYNEVKGDNFVMIGISDDKKDKESHWREMIKEKKMDWINILDFDSSIRNTYSISGIPHVYLIDTDGKILLKGHPVEIIPQVKEIIQKKQH